MNPKKYLQIFLLTLSLILPTLPISAGAQDVATPQTTTQEQVSNEKFNFGKVDEQLLSEIKLLDERFEK